MSKRNTGFSQYMYLPKLNKNQINYFNRPIYSSKKEVVSKSLKPKNVQGQMVYSRILPIFQVRVS